MNQKLSEAPAANNNAEQRSKTPLVDQAIDAAFALMKYMEEQNRQNVSALLSPKNGSQTARVQAPSPAPLSAPSRPRARPERPALGANHKPRPQEPAQEPEEAERISVSDPRRSGEQCGARRVATSRCDTTVGPWSMIQSAEHASWHLKTLAALWYAAGPRGRIAETAWIIAAWKLWPSAFGMSGAEEHPDAARVRSRIAGAEGLLKRRWVSRGDDGLYTIAVAGREQLISALGLTREAFWGVKLVCRKATGSACKLVGPPAKIDGWMTRRKGSKAS